MGDRAYIRTMKFKLYLTLICLLVAWSGQAQVKILFDCTKAETAGNADWVIDADLHNIDWESNDQIGSGTASNPQRYPTPLQNTVTSTTTETYWEGALSHWGIDCVNYGYEVETLTPYDSITYGNASHAQDLMNYKVYVVDEPNIRFTQSEKNAILNFVKNGGGLFMISDHNNSDRNNDGWDSPNIWNDFLDGVSPPNPFGIKFDLDYFSPATTNISTNANDSLTKGPYGNVTMLTYSGATIMHIYPDSNSSATGDIWMDGVSQSSHDSIMFAHAHYGAGKVAAIADSSPPDDGTGNPNCQLYSAYATADNGSDRNLLMNAIIWLAESPSAGTNNLALVTTADTTICKGAQITMTATGSDSYVWQPGGDTGASITVTPATSAPYIVTGTTGGVSKSDTVNVIVDQFPSTTPQVSANGPTDFCYGGSVMLSSPSGSAYHWSTGATTQSITVTHGGSYYLTLTDNNGCTAQSSIVSASVDSLPALTLTISINGATHFCTGGTVTLTAPSGYSYVWNTGSVNQTITTGTQGNYFAVVTDANNCHTNTDTVAVTVSPSLTGVQITANSPLTICYGDSVVLSAPSGYIYQWSTGSQDQSIAVYTAGSYFAYISEGGGCNGITDTLTTSVDTFPRGTYLISALGQTTFCAGDSVVLRAPSANSYAWSNSSTQPQIAVYQTGNYIVTVSDINNCTAATAPVPVAVNPLPVISFAINPDTICSNAAPLALNQASPSGGTYTGNGVNNAQFNPAVAGVGSQTITYTYTDLNNCTNSATQILNVEVCTGINEINGQVVTIFPNPTTGQFTLQLPGTQNNYPVEIYNVLGEKIEQTILTSAENTLNLSNQATGMYFINIQLEEGVATTKVLVTK